MAHKRPRDIACEYIDVARRFAALQVGVDRWAQTLALWQMTAMQEAGGWHKANLAGEDSARRSGRQA